MGYLYLVLAIVSELLGTNLLKASLGFTVLWATIASLLAYSFSFFFLSLTLKSINLNIAYALWAGFGIILTTIVAVIYWKEPINFPSILGISLILIGVIVLNLYGTSH